MNAFLKRSSLLSLVFTGLILTSVPIAASARSSSVLVPESHSITSLEIAQYRHHRRFNLYVRRHHNEEWRLESSYRDYNEAARVARRMERRGFRTYIGSISIRH